ncbi:MAG: carboxypeptidase regulatory-like domain-containing protein, partial [Planctomycetota bacterium]
MKRVPSGRVFAALLLLAALGRADEISGTVTDAQGRPVPGAHVRLEVGKARFALTAEFDRWYAVESKTAQTGEDGRFSFAELPPGAVGTVFVKTETVVGSARGAGKLEVKLGPPGVVRGKVRGKRSDIKGLRVVVYGGDGLGVEESVVDKRTSKYEVRGLAPGAGKILILRNNFEVARQAVTIEAGGTTKLKPIKIKGVLPCPDPTVDCTKAKLVDEKGKPVPGVQLWWSSQWMDGGMASDEKGIVRLAGGGVAIGRPPYRLRIQSLRGKERTYRGVLQKVRGGTAIVQLLPLQTVTGTVKRGDAAVERYLLFVVGPGDAPRVYTARVEDGTYRVALPDGACRF